MTLALRCCTGLPLFILVATVAAGEPSAGSACTIEGASNCQFPADAKSFFGASGFLSDLTVPPNGVVSADDFVPQASTLTQVCVWGFYHDATHPWDFLDCMDAVEDEFRIRVFADVNGLPGFLIGESFVTGTNIQRGPAQGTAFENFFGTNAVPQGYTLTPDASITGMVPGQRHWLEVTNNTRGPTAADQTCWWSWLQHFPPVGDGYSATGANSEGVDDPARYLLGESRYIHGSARMSDLAFCLGTTDGPLDFDSGPPVTAACWTCGDVTGEVVVEPECTVETALNCVSFYGVRGIWNRLDPDCSGSFVDTAVLTNGDACAGPDETARVISDGLYAMNTNCAFPPECGICIEISEGTFAPAAPEVWFHYTATCTGRMTVNACSTQPGLAQNGYELSDGLLALYHDPDNPGECVCPGTGSWFQSGLPSDEGCNGIGDMGAGILSRIVLPGECYTIRMSNWANTAASVASGPAMFDVDCLIQVHPPPPPQPELILGEGGAPDVSTKNRFLSFELPGGSPASVAVRVTFVDAPPPYDLWNGSSMWVDEPFEVPSCFGLCGPGPPPPPYMMATLRCGNPTYRDWGDVGIVHVHHEGIVPGGTYRVDVEDERLLGGFSEPLEMTTARFGDTVESCSAFGCTPPDEDVGIIDALAILGRFASVSGSISLPRADLEPACVDFAINISDVLHSLKGFSGVPYPFTPSAADPCDATCSGP